MTHSDSAATLSGTCHEGMDATEDQKNPQATAPMAGLSALFQRSSAILRTDLRKAIWLVTHNSLAALGLGAVCGTAALLAAPQWRQEAAALLHPAQAEAVQTERLGNALGNAAETVTPLDKVTRKDPKELKTKQQLAVASWLSRRYKVSLEMVSALVNEAWTIGETRKIDPNLLLAIVAIESRFNPYSQSPVGAQGLMQVMTKVHSDKYEAFGGDLAAFDPLSNMHVGAKILHDYMIKTGSIESALKYYVGAADLSSDRGYGAKVFTEYQKLKLVAALREVPILDLPNAKPLPITPAFSAPLPLPNANRTPTATQATPAASPAKRIAISKPPPSKPLPKAEPKSYAVNRHSTAPALQAPARNVRLASYPASGRIRPEDRRADDEIAYNAPQPVILE